MKFNFCRHFPIPAINWNKTKHINSTKAKKKKTNLNTVCISVSGDIDALTWNPSSLLTVYESLQTPSKIMKIKFVFNLKILHVYNVQKLTRYVLM